MCDGLFFVRAGWDDYYASVERYQLGKNVDVKVEDRDV